MPSFAELKAKAAGVTATGVEKLQTARDRNTSVPMGRTNWDPYSGQGPPPPPPRPLVNSAPKLKPTLPPPPSRTGSAAARRESPSPATGPPQLPARSGAPAAPPLPRRTSAVVVPPTRSQPSPAPATGPPPPIVRSTRPDAPSRFGTPQATESDEPEIDWANLTPEDKQVFFSWLDEFFANFTPPTAGHLAEQKDDTIGRARLASPASPAPPLSTSQAPPPLRAATKPASWTRPAFSHQTSEASDDPDGNDAWTLSHPPPTQYGSAALDLAHYFAPSTVWDCFGRPSEQPWYNLTGGGPDSLPPPLRNRSDINYRYSWGSLGTTKTTRLGVFFADLSVCWVSVEFITHYATDAARVKRDAVFLPPPAPLGKEELVEAHETYGETIGLFAESFEGTGEYCARGECWDLANEALKYFADFDYVPKPVPSLSRTHGHLIWEGRVSGPGTAAAVGAQVGRWRGGDDRVRRGDIIEWRKAKVGMKGMSGGRSGHYTLGAPDHTAVIVSDSVPSASTVEDGARVLPRQMGTIVVVEQSVGSPPQRREYDLSLMQEGEVWIYRPVSMETYLGVSDITEMPPDNVRNLQRL